MDPTCRYSSVAFCDALNDHLRDILQGDLVYAPPTRMRNQTRTLVTAVIDTSDLRTPDAPSPTTRPGRLPLLVTTRMKMQLEGAGFDIDPKEPIEQGLLFPPVSSTTTWTWQVTPRSLGTRQLGLHTFIELRDGAATSWHEVTPPAVRSIQVQVNAIEDSRDALAWLWKAVLALASFVAAVTGARKVLRGWGGRATEGKVEIDLRDDTMRESSQNSDRTQSKSLRS
jgi:hypothetical protein